MVESTYAVKINQANLVTLVFDPDTHVRGLVAVNSIFGDVMPTILRYSSICCGEVGIEGIL